MSRRIIALLLFFAVMVCISGCQLESEESSKIDDEKKNLEITVFSIGKADAILLSYGDMHALIDTGEIDDAQMLVRELRNRGIDSIDVMLISHFDKDHVGGASTLMNYFTVGDIYYPDYESDRVEYKLFMDAIKNNAHAKAVTEIVSFSFGDTSWTIYPPEPSLVIDTNDEYDNDLSLVCKVEYQSKSFLFAGDIEKSRIKQMVKSDVDWKADWLKMPHHGDYQKAIKDLLYVVAPSATVITCSKSEPADKQLLEYLKSRNIESYETTNQTVVTSCDGETISINYIR